MKKKRNFKRLVSIAIAITMCMTALSLTSVANDQKRNSKDWEDCKMHYPQLPDPFGWDVFAMMPENILADDFECTESGPITDLHFWGSWYGDDIPFEPVYGAPFGFHISIHADIPDPDEEGPLYSMPGELLWERDIMYPDFICTPEAPGLQGWFEPPDYWEYPNHEQYFRYDILFTEPYFFQEEGTIYWVDIAPYTDGYTWWGWKTSLDHFNDDAVYSIIGGKDTVLSENFDAYIPGVNPFPPTGWTVYNVDGGDAWSLYPGATYAHTGAYCSRCYYDSPNDDWIVSTGIVMPASPVDFSVWVKGSSYTAESFEIWYSTTGNTVADFTGGTLLYAGNAVNAWTLYSYPISESAGTTVWLAIHYTGNYQYYLYCDDWTFPDGSTEGFEGTPASGFPPAGWTMEVVSGTDTDNFWKINDTATNPTGVIPTSTPYMAEYDIYIISNLNSARLYTPPLDFSGTGNSLSFMMYADDDSTTYTDRVVIQVSTDGSTWTNITEFYTWDTTEGWKNRVVDLSGYDGIAPLWVGFLGVSNYGMNNVYIDDVEITNAGGGSGWGELIDPITQESIDLAFVITGEGIPDNPPTACYTWADADGTSPGTTIDFDASCSTDDFGITMYEWDWTSDGIYDYTGGPTASYDYGDTDPHDCTLRVTDTISQTNTFTDTVQALDLVEVLDIEQTVQDRGFPIRHALDGDWGAAQNFTPTLDTMSKVEIYLRMFGTPEFDLTVELRLDHPQGTLLDTMTYTTAEVPTSWTWFEIDFANVTVGAGSDVFIVIPPAPSGVTTSFGYEWGYAFGDQYDGGSFWFTRDSGGLWRDLSEVYEFTFRTYGLGVYVDQPPTACYNWVDADGSGTGTMIDFDASCSTDYEGIVSYEWDWDNDAVYDATGITQSYDFGDTDPHTVGLRVTDTIAQTGIFTDTVQASAGSAVLLTEDFEGGVIPTGWTHTSYDTETWEVNTDFLGNGTYSARVWWSYNEQDEWLITPSVDLSSGTGTLKFFTRFMGENTEGFDWVEHDTVEISTDGGTSWTVIYDLNYDFPDFDWDSEIWETFTVDLSPYLSGGENDVVFAFHRVTPDGGSAAWGIDDIEVSS